MYTLNSDGTIKVNNTGFIPDQVDGGYMTKTAVGKAKQVSGGKLAVSFFGPFYGPCVAVVLSFAVGPLSILTTGLAQVLDHAAVRRCRQWLLSQRRVLVQHRGGAGHVDPQPHTGAARRSANFPNLRHCHQSRHQHHRAPAARHGAGLRLLIGPDRSFVIFAVVLDSPSC